MKTLKDYMETHDECELGDLLITKKEWGYVVSINIGELELSEDDIAKAYEVLTSREVRFCSVCGALMDDGFTDDYGDFYACSEECFEKYHDEVFGKGKWKATDEMTDEDWKHADQRYFDEDTYYTYLDENDVWQPLSTFWTQWY